MEFLNKVVVITGAAGAIGMSICELFARSGARLVLADLDEHKLGESRAGLESIAKELLTFPVDVSQEQQVKTVFEAAIERFGKIDVVVNNAGICKMIPILDITVEQWDRILAVNLRSVFLFSKEAFRYMKEKNYGKIISIGSAAGKIGGLAAGAHYSASKAAVMCFTKSLALQAAPYRINVNAVCPGPAKTEMTDAWGEKANLEFASKIPFKEYARPEDIAEAVLFLASDRAGYITGEILDVNGGLVMD